MGTSTICLRSIKSSLPSLYPYVTHVIKYSRPSTAFPYFKRRKAGRGLGTRLRPRLIRAKKWKTINRFSWEWPKLQQALSSKWVSQALPLSIRQTAYLFQHIRYRFHNLSCASYRSSLSWSSHSLPTDLCGDALCSQHFEYGSNNSHVTSSKPITSCTSMQSQPLLHARCKAYAFIKLQSQHVFTFAREHSYGRG